MVLAAEDQGGDVFQSGGDETLLGDEQRLARLSGGKIGSLVISPEPMSSLRKRLDVFAQELFVHVVRFGGMVYFSWTARGPVPVYS